MEENVGAILVIAQIRGEYKIRPYDDAEEQMKFIEMLNDKATAAVGGVAAGVPALLAEGCATRPCAACFGCAASIVVLGGIWVKGRLNKNSMANSISTGWQGGKEEATQAYMGVRRGADDEGNTASRRKANWQEVVHV